MGLFNKIKNVFSKDKEAAKYEEGLTKTRKEFSTELAKLSKKYKNIDDDYFEELENILIMADIGVNTVVKFVDKWHQGIAETGSSLFCRAYCRIQSEGTPERFSQHFSFICWNGFR